MLLSRGSWVDHLEILTTPPFRCHNPSREVGIIFCPPVLSLCVPFLCFNILDITFVTIKKMAHLPPSWERSGGEGDGTGQTRNTLQCHVYLMCKMFTSWVAACRLVLCTFLESKILLHFSCIYKE